MKIIKWDQFLKKGLTRIIKEKKTSMTVGVFDGVHLGHQALLKHIVSHNVQYTPVVVTFRQNHKTELNKNILNFPRKLKKLKHNGIKIVIVIDFTEDFKKAPGIEFLKILLKQGNIGFFAAGSSFRCGYKLDTGAEEIKKFFAQQNIPAEIIQEVTEGSFPISSSRIRAAIAKGDHQLAEKMLEQHQDKKTL